MEEVGEEKSYFCGCDNSVPPSDQDEIADESAEPEQKNN